MALNSQQRGKVFELFIKQILLNSGFSEVPTDNFLVYQGTSGLMLHGLAQPHNADVLVDPPFQIPFFFPSRLIIECKCYKTPIGLTVLRNALGLRNDINGFDIVNEEILRNRRNPRRVTASVFNQNRYFYQVAVASMNGFKKPAEEFALVHRIPLIDIGRMPFKQSLESMLFSREFQDDHDQDLNDTQESQDINDFRTTIAWTAIREEMNAHLDRFTVGILSSGDILFIYTHTNEGWLFDAREIELHWSSNRRLWQISPRGENLEGESWFELPNILFDPWAASGFRKDDAIDIKEKHFKDLYIMGKDRTGRVRLQLLSLSKTFVDEARHSLRSSPE